MEHKEGRSGKRSRGSKRSYSSKASGGNGGGRVAGTGSGRDREEVVKEAVASVIVTERSKYESRIRESQSRLDKYTSENDRLLDEVSNLRLQIREMKNDRSELVRAHHESMSLLAQVSEEKLVEFKSKSEQEAIESKAAQEEALRTVLEMMEKDCEDRVAELDNELARVEEERERAARLQLEAATKAEEEERNKRDVEDAAKLAVEKLVAERATRDAEVQDLEDKERELKRELEATRQRADADKRAAVEAREAAEVARAAAMEAELNSNSRAGEDDGGGGDNGSTSDGSRSSHSSDGPHSEDGSEPSAASPLIQESGPGGEGGGRNVPEEDEEEEQAPLRPPVINRRPMQRPCESPFLKDHPSEMTRGRRTAMKLQKLPWYQPRGKKHWDTEGLGLQSAWAYFEHSILPRYIVKNADGTTPSSPKLPEGISGRVRVYESDTGSTDGGDADDRRSDGGDSDVDDWLYTPKPKNKRQKSTGGVGRLRCCNQKGDLSRAEPGESNLPSRLYSPLFTPLSQMGDFGIGVGLYFSSLRAMALISLIAGCINVPNILYFASEDYSRSQPNVNFVLRGSAICTERAWVPCPTCTLDQFAQARGRIAGTTTVTLSGELRTLVFALKNGCNGATFQVGIMNMAALGFVILAIGILSLYQRKRQVDFDEQEQTAQDYSIEISNPPSDATEPEEWKEFFESRFGGHLTCCTVTIDNDLLVKALAQRREVMFDIEERLKEGATINTLTLSELVAKIEHGRKFLGRLKSRLSPGIPELAGRLIVLNARIQGLAQQEYRATRVFCTFETEGAQRQVLTQMTVGSYAAMRNKTHKINPNLLFRGEHVLLVREAEEPNTVRWQDLDVSWCARIKQVSTSTIISLAVTLGVTVVVTFLRRENAAYAALAISISNASFPMIAKSMTDLEAHPTETVKQSSLYVKIALFRWVVTAIVITIITPFTSTIMDGPEHLLQSVYVIFFADLVITNASQLLDPVGNFKRHFLAPRAESQERMNLLMGGTEYHIAERYTNMTKTLFLTFYYCAIFPGAFFLCALTLTVNFFTDKFSLMRTWKPAPLLGAYIANFSRVYFMTITIAALAVASSYMFSGFPFDNLCAEDISHSAYYGTWKITNGEGEDSTAIIEPTSRSFHFCNQYLGPGSNFAFPALPKWQPHGSHWMTDEQEQLTGIYGWVSVGVLGLVGLVFLLRVIRTMRDFFSPKYESVGSVQGESFSQVDSISSYIPQIASSHFTHPLLAVNIDYIDESIIDWTDPERSHSYYDLTRDAEQLMKGNEDACRQAFAQIRHWPPGGIGGNGVEEGSSNGGGHGDRDGVSVASAKKSALRKSRDIQGGMARRSGNSVSWSSKVTCKTYSKDDPNAYSSFNANASTSEGMNFNGHSDPLFDPHSQNEARVYRENPPNDAAYNPTNDGDFQGNGNNQQPQLNQPPSNQHFDQYYGTGLDYDQPPDPFYQDSQDQDQNIEDGATWEVGSDGTGSFGQQSGSSGTASSYNSGSSGSGSYSHSDAESSNDGGSQFQNNGDDESGTYEGSGGSSRDGSDSSSSASPFSGPPGVGDGQNQGQFYDEAEIYEDDENWDDDDNGQEEAGSYSTSSSASGAGLPPIS